MSITNWDVRTIEVVLKVNCMRTTNPDKRWQIPCGRLMEMKRPDGTPHLAVTGQGGHIKSYLSRFGVVPVMYGNEKKFARLISDGEWDILDIDVCPEISDQSQKLTELAAANQTLVKCEWQLVGYTIQRVLVRLMLDQSGEGHWLIARWGAEDTSPDLKDGYFNYTLENDTLNIKWPNRGASQIAIQLFRKINVCSAAQGMLSFFDYELKVDCHVIPEHVHDLNGWPLTYWGTEQGESAE